MTTEKQQTLLEICYEQVSRIHSDLCRCRQFDKAEKSRAVLKGIIDLSNMLEDKEDEQ